MTVPKGAEVLLETRLPYLDAAQRREVLRTTAFPAGNPLMDGPEQWGRLNLFAAADGYGAFDTDVRVTMDGDGFGANDSWRNDIAGTGGLVKAGSGTLTLTGANRYRGGTTVEAGTLVAASPSALGLGPVEVRGGVLRLAQGQHVSDYRQTGGRLVLRLGDVLSAAGGSVVVSGGVLEIAVDSTWPSGQVHVLTARRVRGRFAAIEVDRPGLRAVPSYGPTGMSVRIVRESS
jgi:autotransporter-associated beta strand protein